MNDANLPSNRPRTPEAKYRLYLDESGDHVFRRLNQEMHRYLCLLGCWFRGDHYRAFHTAMEQFKQHHIPHNPDEPVVLHRSDIINRRGAFWRLRDEQARRKFDDALLQLIGDAAFRVVAVVIDKRALRDKYPAPAHPYHLALGFMLQRYCGLLNHTNRCGDVMAESRGGREDRLLKDSYCRVYERGSWMHRADFFQEALTSGELKLKPKSSNIAGLQLADLLGHPVKQQILVDKGRIPEVTGRFSQRVLAVLRSKYNRHLYDNRIEGYGTVLFPR